MIAFVSAAWRRYEITRLALAQRAHLIGVLAGQGCEATQVVVADDENLDIAREFGFHTLNRPNDRLGFKFNEGIEFAVRELGAGHIVLIGSDNWMHEALFERLPLEVAEFPTPTAEQPFVAWSGEAEMTTGRQIAVADTRRGVITICHTGNRYGVIPWVLPSKAFESTGYRPILDNLNTGIDGSLIAGLERRPRCVFSDPHPFARVDFKSEVNLNSYDSLRRGAGVGDEMPIEALRDYYPAELVGML